jgi:hypothetical protein
MGMTPVLVNRLPSRSKVVRIPASPLPPRKENTFLNPVLSRLMHKCLSATNSQDIRKMQAELMGELNNPALTLPCARTVLRRLADVGAYLATYSQPKRLLKTDSCEDVRLNSLVNAYQAVEGARKASEGLNRDDRVVVDRVGAWWCLLLAREGYAAKVHFYGNRAPAQLIGRLRSRTATIHGIAMKELEQGGTRLIPGFMADMVNHRDGPISLSAGVDVKLQSFLYAVDKIGEPAIPVMLDYWRISAPAVVSVVNDWAMHAGTRIAGYLVAMLADADERVVSRAAWILAKLCEQGDDENEKAQKRMRYLRPVVELLGKGSQPQRDQIVFILSAGAKTPLPLLDKPLHSEDPAVRLDAQRLENLL